MTQEELKGVPHMISKIMSTQKEIIDLLYSQVVDLTLLSKIELGDDVIAEISRLNAKLVDEETRMQHPANVEGSLEFNEATVTFDLTSAQEALADARMLIESFDCTSAMTLAFDKDWYTLSPKNMLCIASALYLADTQLYYVSQFLNKK